MNTDRAARIKSIIEQRTPFVGRIERAETNLTLLEEALHTMEEERNQLLGVVAEGNPVTCSRLKNLDLTKVRDRVVEEMVPLRKLRSRFSRATLNIGVIGRAGQGKSRLLQSLSGLDATVIPDGKGGDCTAVRSTVYHDPSAEPCCDVNFYTAASFLNDIIRPYYDYLELRPVPRSMNDFSSQPLSPLPPHKANLEEAKTRYAHLQNFKNNIESYRDKLDLPPTRIPITEVPRYVTQNSKDERQRYLFLAVREVKILCKFPHEDIGQIALIDMPGLGNTTIGDVKRMVTILGQDVDAVLFVKRPDNLRDGWRDVDAALYDLAASALDELQIDLWSFMVLNSLGENSEECEKLQKLFETEPHRKFVKSLVANCAIPKEVSATVLEAVLNYLERQIGDLDARYASACQERLYGLQGEITALVSSAGGTLGRGTPVEGEIAHFNTLFELVWSDLTVGLEDLRQERRALNDAPDERLARQVQECFARCREDTGIPPIEEIERLSKLHGSYDTAFHLCLHRVRTNLAENFLAMEDVLHHSLEDARQQVASVLRNAGRLEKLSSAEGTGFLRDIAHHIPPELEGLRQAFETLSSVELSYRGFLQYRVRQHLGTLIPNECRMTVAPNAGSVHQTLEVLLDKTLYNLDGAFQDWLREPNLVAHAIVEEFVDRVLRAEKSKDEWRGFYLEMRAQVWEAEFDELGDRSRLRQQWDAALRLVTERNDKTAFTIN